MSFATSTGVLDRSMNKPTGRPKTSTRDDVVARVDREVIKRDRYVADTRKVPLAQYLSEILAPVVQKDFERVIKEGGTK